MKYSGNGNHDIHFEEDSLLTVRTTKEFTIIIGEDITAPNKSTDRYAQIEVKKGELVHLITDEHYTIITKEKANRYEENNGENLVEVIPENEMSLYDRLRQDMIGIMTTYMKD